MYIPFNTLDARCQNAFGSHAFYTGFMTRETVVLRGCILILYYWRDSSKGEIIIRTQCNIGPNWKETVSRKPSRETAVLLLCADKGRTVRDISSRQPFVNSYPVNDNDGIRNATVRKSRSQANPSIPIKKKMCAFDQAWEKKNNRYRKRRIFLPNSSLNL